MAIEVYSAFRRGLKIRFGKVQYYFVMSYFQFKPPTDVIQTVGPANKQRENPSFLWQFALSHARHFVVSEDEVKKH